ncbi:methylated-DNA--[protein]-cysteine S-methyltransferase [Clavibacter lycopersici]|uniref:Methylated-DNA--protein-cysteine methyltransferase n=1 Tax=Clavibacter lycopersici TaxID=2301718 RepID=A0A399TDH9_9MICO|nr:methylated-DNA--[protein]-cysteine S-methyltransferase [Clavibacter lycopersici]RIJ52387.1 methylated-DNA--[protein]-cysteine S-methyltransferase [Clavibacter lycopersici]RIJ62481.1 methylated-DNA--[protein]-cysteine S-methyltransferase [Clavibacter lycopersici]
MTRSPAPAARAALRPPVSPPRVRRPGSLGLDADARRPLPPAPALLPAGAALLRVPSPVGRLELVGEGEELVAVSIATAGVLPLDHLDDRPSPVLAETARQLDEHFAGTRRSFDVPVRLRGTPFQVAIWEALARVPYGGVTTYGALAQAAGRPGGARAVGGAVGANRLCILIPCHRVLGADGRVTGFSAGDGVATKVQLLALEGSVLS